MLEEKYPEKDNVNLRFTDLHNWVINLNGFDDAPNNSNEKILEAIQMAWIDEEINMKINFNEFKKINNLPEKCEKIVVAMSGGVDSSVTAAILNYWI